MSLKEQAHFDLKKNLLGDISLENSKTKYAIFTCLGILLFLFISLYVAEFIIVATALICCALLFERSYRKIYYLVFFIPLINIFYYNDLSINLLSLVALLVVVMTFINLLVDLIKKRKKIRIISTVLIALLIIFLFYPYSFSNINQMLGIITGLSFIYFTAYYKDELNFKELVFMFTLGVLSAILFGLFRETSPRLVNLVPLFSANGLIRFSGISNPNFLADEMILCLAFIYVLIIKNKIKIIYFPILIVFTITLIFTMSKSGLIIYLVSFILFAIFYLCKDFSKKKLIITLSILFLFVCMFLAFIERVLPYFGRLEADENVLSEVTTGRWDLWCQYIEKIFASFKTAMFGYGIGAQDVGAYNNVTMSSHNTFLQMAYYSGIIGCLLMVAFLLSCIDFKKIRKESWALLIPLIAIFLYMCCDNIFNYKLFIYLIMIFTLIINDKAIGKKEDKEIDKKVTSNLKNENI